MFYMRLHRTWTDTDGMIQVSFQASNGPQSATIEFYAYPEEISDFSKALIEFPFTPNNHASFEYGTDPSYCCLFKLSAKLRNLSGHPVIELKYDNRRAIPEKAEGLFYMPCEATLINSFGKQLSKFATGEKSNIELEWSNT
ncbi:hypothetical protein [Aquipseudomonas guryensis]|jgi:hypothetical protein|uniref:Uncharacterized protein n=1 Tax=Aquipseudomonas guryensis TaxID=2759165 RepID=A0A7W4DEZ0_9GAMM|nr:hypothetical protein [Pseudomonas guryensis]MBB1521370.1 hypothetical protein [Pseudomonas guryensis]